MTERQMTCIICPMGCSITVKMEGEEILEISGNTCKRGAAYAEAETRHPERTVTTTMRCQDGQILSVKTDRPIPKSKIMECMDRINRHRAAVPVAIGDILLRDVFGSNVVATENKPSLGWIP
nr:DUF1667 domain-containing protein [uncultured Acetatifactor sp.]